MQTNSDEEVDAQLCENLRDGQFILFPLTALLSAAPLLLSMLPFAVPVSLRSLEGGTHSAG